METMGEYLVRSVLWTVGFAAVYIVFLRNENYFRLNRFYLLAGIISSLVLPFITLRYVVMVEAPAGIQAGAAAVSGTPETALRPKPGIGSLLLFIYAAGVVAMTVRYVFRSAATFRSLKSGPGESGWPVRLVRSEKFVTPFSFFSFVVVNPSVGEAETREIVNHEMVHVRQRHWFDLVLTGVLCTVQWFNPFAWIYSRLVRQNHEYLADREALERTANPAVYRAALLNQLVGSPVIDLGNLFTYSLNKQRFKMMKNKISPPRRKLRLLAIIPVIAGMLYAFAEPEYATADNSSTATGDSFAPVQKGGLVSGNVSTGAGKALGGASVIIKGTTVGTVTDDNGHFSLKDVNKDAVLFFSYVGFGTREVKAVFGSEMKVVMEPATFITDTVVVAPPPPPPPPPPPMPSSLTGGNPLIVIDGKISDRNISEIPPESIESVRVLKDETATNKYGDKGKNGVIEITLKKENPSLGVPVDKPGEKSSGEIFTVVEKLPEFPGGESAMKAWIAKNVSYPKEAIEKKISGVVPVRFTVTSAGKVKNVMVVRPVNPLLDAEAVRVIGSMPDWSPGMQHGKPVDVNYGIPVEFSLEGKVLKSGIMIKQ